MTAAERLLLLATAALARLTARRDPPDLIAAAEREVARAMEDVEREAHGEANER